MFSLAYIAQHHQYKTETIQSPQEGPHFQNLFHKSKQERSSEIFSPHVVFVNTVFPQIYLITWMRSWQGDNSVLWVIKQSSLSTFLEHVRKDIVVSY